MLRSPQCHVNPGGFHFRMEYMTPTYVKAYAQPGHPLTTRGHSIGEHRLVLWDKIGPGTHPCFYCGTPVTWSPGKRTRKGALVVEHLDYNIRNNNPDNLVPSCHPCNSDRRRKKRHIADGELFVIKSAGRRLRAIETRCEECDVTIVDARSQRRRFCNRICSGRSIRRKQLAMSNHNASSIRDGELFVIIGGRRLRAVLQRCEACGEDYAVAACNAKRRKLCSRQCTPSHQTSSTSKRSLARIRQASRQK